MLLTPPSTLGCLFTVAFKMHIWELTCHLGAKQREDAVRLEEYTGAGVIFMNNSHGTSLLIPVHH